MRKYKGEVCKLSDLTVGQECKILNINDTKSNIKTHLLEMGLTKGVNVKVKKVAPFGEPVIISLRGYELCLRIEELKCIKVEVI